MCRCITVFHVKGFLLLLIKVKTGMLKSEKQPVMQNKTDCPWHDGDTHCASRPVRRCHKWRESLFMKISLLILHIYNALPERGEQRIAHNNIDAKLISTAGNQTVETQVAVLLCTAALILLLKDPCLLVTKVNNSNWKNRYIYEMDWDSYINYHSYF